MRKQDVAEGRGLEPNVYVLKICVKFYCGGAVKKLMYHRPRFSGEASSCCGLLAIFRTFLNSEKNSYFNAI